GFGTLFFGELEVVAFVHCQAEQVVEIGFGSARSSSVGPMINFQLQDPHVDPHLQQLASVAAADQPCADFAWLVGPIAENRIDMSRFGHSLGRKRREVTVEGYGELYPRRVRRGHLRREWVVGD